MTGKKDRKARKPTGAASVESRRIDWIRKLLESHPRGGLSLGIGDDAAVWKPRQGYRTVLTVDTQSEGTHFMPGWLSPGEIGRRAVSSSISDLAAMNARPALVLVSLLLERGRSEDFFRKLYRGIDKACRDYGALIAGGNISRGPLSITITCIGEARKKDLTGRNGMENGDEIWVTGNPGLARLGLLHLQDRLFGRSPSPGARQAISAFKNPRARTGEAAALGRSWRPNAAIDLSDGLHKDLLHLLESNTKKGLSANGIVLDKKAIESLEPLGKLCAEAGLSPCRASLEGGEDYELLLAIPPGRATAARVRAFREKFDVPITRIGTVTSKKPGVWLKTHSSGTLTRLRADGFEHF